VTIVVLVLRRADEGNNRRRVLRGDLRFRGPTFGDNSFVDGRMTMARGDKSKCTDQQKRPTERSNLSCIRCVSTLQ